MACLIDIEAIRQASPISEVIGRVVPLRRAGNSLMGCCPFHEDRTPSLSVSEAHGRFKCFGCGAKGDVFEFIMRQERVGFLEAVELLQAGLPLGNHLPPKATKATKGRSSGDLALKLWNEAAEIHGTVAETYLAMRGLPLASLPPLPNFRSARLWHRETDEKHPALVTAVRAANGTFMGVQRTYLTEEGKKLDVDDPKLSLGKIRTGSIQMGERRDTIIVCEGCEDGLSLLHEVPNSAVWVAAGASMMAAMELPQECHEVIIAADNDAAGRKSADDAATAFRRTGRCVRIAHPAPQFKDFNEQLRAGLSL